jgi:hypothetical protein
MKWEDRIQQNWAWGNSSHYHPVSLTVSSVKDISLTQLFRSVSIRLPTAFSPTR